MKAYLTWAARREATGLGQSHKVERKSLQEELEGWCQELLRVELPDPIIEKRILQLVVEISVKALPSVPSLAFNICQYVLANPPIPESRFTPYDEAVKDLDSVRPRELQKLAMNFTDSFFVSQQLIVALSLLTTMISLSFKLSVRASSTSRHSME